MREIPWEIAMGKKKTGKKGGIIYWDIRKCSSSSIVNQIVRIICGSSRSKCETWYFIGIELDTHGS